MFNRTLVENQMELWEANEKPSEELAFLASLIALPDSVDLSLHVMGYVMSWVPNFPPKDGGSLIPNTSRCELIWK